MIRTYPKPIKRLIREYAIKAYEAELGLALGELEQHFGAWRSGQIQASELSDRIHDFNRGPARELWGRYNARMDDVQVAHAIAKGLLLRDDMPPELLDALQPLLSFYGHEGEDSVADKLPPTETQA